MKLLLAQGRAALARAIIIGAQEFGHYADIIRKGSSYTGRHSGDLYLRYFNIGFNNKRLSDIRNINNFYANISNIGLQKFIQLEKGIKFYDNNKLNYLKHKILRVIFYIRRYFFFRKIIKILPSLQALKKYKYYILTIEEMFEDMLFNLEPKADVYSHNNKDVEIAIAYAEALARVPQQVKKWGKSICAAFYKELYIFYYNEVIPKKVEEFRILIENTSYNNVNNYNFISKWRRIIIVIKEFIRKKHKN